MIYVRLNGELHPATIHGKISDPEWDGRETKTITLTMDYATAAETFINGLIWSIVEISGESMKEYSNNIFTLAGDLIDHRNGTITAKMGRLTPLEEAYEIMFGGMENVNQG